jgi:hypothetical protein
MVFAAKLQQNAPTSRKGDLFCQGGISKLFWHKQSTHNTTHYVDKPLD